MKIKEIISEHLQVNQAILHNGSLLQVVQQIADQISAAFLRGRRVYFCGNGGSAADAQHLAAEFSGRFYLDRKALPAEALHCNTSYLTAVANDYSYDLIYTRLIEGLGEEGDVLIGLSTSGNSVNIVRALEKAREKRMLTIAFTGEGGGQLREVADLLIAIPSTNTPRIQESHMLLGHIICQLVEAACFPATIEPK